MIYNFTEKPKQILNFWFGELSAEGLPQAAIAKQWWQKDSSFDAAVREQFAVDVECAAKGEYDDWQQTPAGMLALIILLDQFSRNIFRDTPAAFENDAQARTIATQGLQKEFDQQLKPIERVFFYLPFEHSEDLKDQQKSVALIQNTCYIFAK